MNRDQKNLYLATVGLHQQPHLLIQPIPTSSSWHFSPGGQVPSLSLNAILRTSSSAGLPWPVHIPPPCRGRTGPTPFPRPSPDSTSCPSLPFPTDLLSLPGRQLTASGPGTSSCTLSSLPHPLGPTSDFQPLRDQDFDGDFHGTWSAARGPGHNQTLSCRCFFGHL